MRAETGLTLQSESESVVLLDTLQKVGVHEAMISCGDDRLQICDINHM